MTDHKAEAQELFDAEFGPRQNQLGFETADAQHVINMLGALTQATVYLAEQQRIANVIALGKYKTADGSRPFQHFVAPPTGEYSVALDTEIREGLWS